MKEGVCIDPSTPDTVPSGTAAPAFELMNPTADLFPAPFCNKKEEAKKEHENPLPLAKANGTCHCVRGVTATKLDERGRLRGNCTGYILLKNYNYLVTFYL